MGSTSKVDVHKQNSGRAVPRRPHLRLAGRILTWFHRTHTTQSRVSLVTKNQMPISNQFPRNQTVLPKAMAG